MEKLEGQVTRIVYRNDETGWSVIELTDDDGGEIAATGIMPLCAPGERVELFGNYVEHKSYGMQFNAKQINSIAPADLAGIESFLSSGLIKGVGAATARRIVNAFGMDTLKVIEEEPERLKEIKSIPRSRIDGIVESYMAQRAQRDTMITLLSYGISVKQSIKLKNIYGNECLARIQENPYRLVEEIEGIGFKTADKIAKNMGIEPNSKRRVRAGCSFALTWAAQEGHTYLPEEKLINVAEEILLVDRELVSDTIAGLIEDGTLIKSEMAGESAIYLPPFYYMEKRAAKKLTELANQYLDASSIDLERELIKLEKELKIDLAVHQKEAVISSLTSGAMVITGGPGTGKTTILQFILHILSRLGLDFAICAPTGRAAKRMTEATGFDACTIHRLLEYGGEGMRFNRDENDPLLFDMIIVDEMSMVDLPLFNALLAALCEGTRLVMVGDADQLPPVGAGMVLHDIIKSRELNVIRLTEIFRQAGRSGIAGNARRINKGMEPIPSDDSDFTFHYAPVSQQATDAVLAVCRGGMGVSTFTDPYKDMQVLSPMKKGSLGVKALNKCLQEALNPSAPHKAQHEYLETIFREGDKVMQIKNDYRMEWTRFKDGELTSGTGVYNGDIGIIYQIDVDEQSIRVLFDDERMSVYTYQQLDELELAYCMSIHKSQGSEFPLVILPIISGPPMLMTRNLLYTAVTRARSRVIIIGDWDGVMQMVANKSMKKRFSALGERIKQEQARGEAYENA